MKPSKALLQLFREECAEKCRDYKVFVHQIPYLAAYQIQYDYCLKKCTETKITEGNEYDSGLRHNNR